MLYELLSAHLSELEVELLSHLALSLNLGAVHGFHEVEDALLGAQLQDEVVGDRQPVRLVLIVVDVVDQGHV